METAQITPSGAEPEPPPTTAQQEAGEGQTSQPSSIEQKEEEASPTPEVVVISPVKGGAVAPARELQSPGGLTVKGKINLFASGDLGFSKPFEKKDRKGRRGSSQPDRLKKAEKNPVHVYNMFSPFEDPEGAP